MPDLLVVGGRHDSATGAVDFFAEAPGAGQT
ncbi:hypothetical protein HNQ09_003578 [Deinococcus budaensis]|uniref:Uncharacterized protein n=1 Tax=Deinococcus budaensis TaxID=1665626 RepID=A0A7W8GI72_9DEIO|nr:hypothetical protein [Deinococcus budaensis]